MKLTTCLLLSVAVVLYLSVPGEQQMIVRRQSGQGEISNYDTVFSRRDDATNVDEDCSGHKAASQPGQTPVKQKPSEKSNSPPQKSPPKSGSTSNTGKVDLKVPETLSFGQNFTGDATYYGSAGGGGACGFGGFKSTLPGIAIGADIFGLGEACGACVKLYPGQHGTPVVVYVDNKCPECGRGTDLSTEAWNKLTTETPTRFPVHWEFVPCGLTSSAEIQWVSKGNLYDARFNFRAVSGAVFKAEISIDADNWLELKHKDTTSFVLVDSGKDHAVLSQDSFSIRLTNVKGEQITCSDLKAASWDSATDSWLTCPTSFQFAST